MGRLRTDYHLLAIEVVRVADAVVAAVRFQHGIGAGTLRVVGWQGAVVKVLPGDVAGRAWPRVKV